MPKSMPIMAALKEATHDAHQRLERLPLATALQRKELPIEGFVGHLRAMSVLHGVLEHELPVETEPAIKAVWGEDMRKLPLLQRDLSHFRRQGIRDIAPAVQVAVRAANRLRLRCLQEPVSALGALYVLEGSTLGGIELAGWARTAYGIDGASGLAYLEGYGRSTRDHWDVFSARMNNLSLGERARESIIDAAIETFEAVGAIVFELHPFDPGDLDVTATTLNPEAGTHPVPRDSRALAAAERAGRRCVEEYPYFTWRYGERGHRFTDSDGAWLAALVDYPMARVQRQVDWLATVLATRGMPRILLQRHLELLYEELTARIPNREREHLKLLAVADTLADARRAVIADADLRRISRQFEERIEPEWAARLPNMGAIVVSAVADEHDGLAGTLRSVREWVTSTSRFSPQWIEAVEDAIAESQRVLIAPAQQAVSQPDA